MSLSSEERQIMVQLEIERAEKIIHQEVPVMVNAQLWNMLANRLYYAVFHALSALLIKHGIQVSSHKGALMMFNQKFVATGAFSVEDRKVIAQLEGLREIGDYNCFIETTQEEITPYIDKASTLVNKFKEALIY